MDERLYDMDTKQVALDLAQEAIDNISFFDVSEHMEFDLDIEDRDLHNEVYDIIVQEIVAVIE